MGARKQNRLSVDGKEILDVKFLMQKIFKDITEPIFFITNDVSRGLGLEKLLPNYHIICIDDHPLVGYLLKDGINVFCLEKEFGRKNVIFRSSAKLLAQPLVERYISEKAQGRVPWIMYFKPSVQIDLLCKKRGYKKIGNEAGLNRLFENKLSFFDLCQRWGLPTALGEIAGLNKADFSQLKSKYGSRLVIQYGRGWAGETTFFINNQEQLNELKRQVGPIKVRVSKKIEGKTILNNCCVLPSRVLVGLPAWQITAIPGLTRGPGSTCGRSWPAKITKDQFNQVRKISEEVGIKMGQAGYLGYFGLDFLIESQTGKIFLSENNARLTASTSFYSKLEIKAQSWPLLTGHILAFVGLKENTCRYFNSAREGKIVGTELIARNDEVFPVKIKKDFEPGVYRFSRGEISFVGPGNDIESVKSKNEFFITTSAKDRLVNPGLEMVRLNSLDKLVNDEGELEVQVKDAILKIKSNLVQSKNVT